MISDCYDRPVEYGTLPYSDISAVRQRVTNGSWLPLCKPCYFIGVVRLSAGHNITLDDLRKMRSAESTIRPERP